MQLLQKLVDAGGASSKNSKQRLFCAKPFFLPFFENFGGEAALTY